MDFVDKLLGNPQHYSKTMRLLHSRYIASGWSPFVRALLRLTSVRRMKKRAWEQFWPAFWPLTSALLRSAARRRAAKGPENTNFSRALMLVSEPMSDRHWPNETPNATDLFSRWLVENQGIADVDYGSSLRNISELPPNTVIVANYDWLANLLTSPHPFYSVLREALAAQKLGAPIWVPLIDLFGVRYATYSTILAASSGGVNIICQNAPIEAERYGLPNVSGPHLWQFPPSELALFSRTASWQEKKMGAAVAFSGDSRRVIYFPPLISKLEERGFDVRKTNQNLPYDDYIIQIKSMKIVATTCWLQPFYLVGPQHYRRLLPAGHITRRVWEAFAAGNALLTNDTPAIRSFGFFPGEHFVALPETPQDWASWVLPDDLALEKIAVRGELQFGSLVTAMKKGR